MVGPGAGLLDVEGIPLVSISPRTRSVAASRVKRAIDIVGASVGLILAAPLFLWAAWRIPRESPGPVFYRQTRLGANMQEFTMLKFRTMTVDADAVRAPGLYRAGHERGATHRASVSSTSSTAATSSRRPGAGCAERASMSCRSSSMSCRARCRSWGRGRAWPTRRSISPRTTSSASSLHPGSPASGRSRHVRTPASPRRSRWTSRTSATGRSALDLSLLLRTPVEVLRQRRATV